MTSLEGAQKAPPEQPSWASRLRKDVVAPPVRRPKLSPLDVIRMRETGYREGTSAEDFARTKQVFAEKFTYKPPTYKRHGLKNNTGGNICYVNAVVQALLPCSMLMRFLSFCQDDPKFPFYSCLFRLCKQFHQTSTEPLSVSDYLSEVAEKWTAYQFGRQQDAGEFLNYLLQGMHEECKWTIKAPQEDEWAQVGKNSKAVNVQKGALAEESPITRLFGGKTKNMLIKSSKTESATYEPFTLLTLDLTDPSVHTISDAIAKYSTKQRFGSRQGRLIFQELPPILLISLNRIHFNKSTGQAEKLQKEVSFETSLKFPKDCTAETVPETTYTLVSVINHISNKTEEGHYNTATLFNSEWYIFDDALVKAVDFAHVTSQRLNAYIFVYINTAAAVSLIPED